MPSVKCKVQKENDLVLGFFTTDRDVSLGVREQRPYWQLPSHRPASLYVGVHQFIHVEMQLSNSFSLRTVIPRGFFKSPFLPGKSSIKGP